MKHKFMTALMVFCLAVFMVLPASAASTEYMELCEANKMYFKNQPLLTFKDYEYFFYKYHANNSGTLYVFDSSDFTITTVDGVETINFTKLKYGTVEWIFLDDGSLDGYSSSGLSTTSGFFPLSNWSDYSFGYATNIDFFPKTPLHQIVGEVTGTAAAEAMAGLVNPISILVLSGVGCLALLIVFPLLRRVLYRFLG